MPGEEEAEEPAEGNASADVALESPSELGPSGTGMSLSGFEDASGTVVSEAEADASNGRLPEAVEQAGSAPSPDPTPGESEVLEAGIAPSDPLPSPIGEADVPDQGTEAVDPLLSPSGGAEVPEGAVPTDPLPSASPAEVEAPDPDAVADSGAGGSIDAASALLSSDLPAPIEADQPDQPDRVAPASDDPDNAVASSPVVPASDDPNNAVASSPAGPEEVPLSPTADPGDPGAAVSSAEAVGANPDPVGVDPDQSQGFEDSFESYDDPTSTGQLGSRSASRDPNAGAGLSGTDVVAAPGEAEVSDPSVQRADEPKGSTADLSSREAEPAAEIKSEPSGLQIDTSLGEASPERTGRTGRTGTLSDNEPRKRESQKRVQASPSRPSPMGASASSPTLGSNADLKERTAFTGSTVDGVLKRVTYMTQMSRYPQGPKYTLAARGQSIFVRSSANPAPGSYNVPEGSKTNKYKVAPRFSFGGSSRFGLGESPTKKSPGPGAYNPIDPLLRTDTKVGFGTSSREQQKSMLSANPGPGAYESRSQVGGRMFTAGGRHPTSYLRARSQPGPGAYNPSTHSVLSQPPKCGFGTSTRDDVAARARSIIAPGPGTYELQNIRSTGSDAPKYSATSRRRLHDLNSYLTPGPGSYNAHVTQFGYRDFSALDQSHVQRF